MSKFFYLRISFFHGCVDPLCGIEINDTWIMKENREQTERYF